MTCTHCTPTESSSCEHRQFMDPPDKRLGIDEYSDVTMLTKPIIYVKEICSTHSVSLHLLECA